MKYNLIAVIITFAVNYAASAQPQPKPPMEALAYIRVGVTNPITGARKELTRGSGFLIDLTGHIITARHVILAKEQEEPGARWISISLRDKNRFPVPAQLVACDSGNIDLCLVKISDSSVSAEGVSNVFKPVCRQLAYDERIVALGFPFGDDNPAIRVPGDITGSLATELKYPSNVQIIPGMSGGPVLDNAGNVVAVNAAGSALFPTMTFLQPLFNAQALVQRSGVNCASGTAPASSSPVTASTTNPEFSTPTRCGSREQVISRTQYTQNESSPTSKAYFEVIEPDTGCKITSVTPEIKSANNSSGPSISIAPDGKAAKIEYSLQSGPFFDRYRGWIELNLKIAQSPRQ